MTSLNEHSLKQALKDLGIQSGDTVLLHSDLMALGVPEGSKKRSEILEFYEAVFKEVLGPEGTLSVPAFYYEYARFGLPFDTHSSSVSKSLGAFSAHLCTLKETVRSCNPLQSIASIGPKAVEISGSNSLNGYGVISPWHRLRLNKAKIVFLGVTMQSMTYVHYIEQEVGVPHVYFKVFGYPVYRKGQLIPGNPISAVRYLNYGIQYVLKPFQDHLFAKGYAKAAQIGKGEILVVGAEEAYQEGIKLLENNPYYFLKETPHFTPGTIPFDGVTGKLIQEKS